MLIGTMFRRANVPVKRRRNNLIELRNRTARVLERQTSWSVRVPSKIGTRARNSISFPLVFLSLEVEKTKNSLV
jgi:hypothetical protein